MKDYYEIQRDEQFKWFSFPFFQASPQFAKAGEQVQKDQATLGWFTSFATSALPNFEAFHDVVTRTRLRIALIQAVEAIRMSAAENGGKLIPTLDESIVPIPLDPFTGQPFTYETLGGVGVLSSAYPASVPMRIELRFAE
jgi:hypothetical protein